jgi:hypothetical protein
MMMAPTPVLKPVSSAWGLAYFFGRDGAGAVVLAGGAFVFRTVEVVAGPAGCEGFGLTVFLSIVGSCFWGNFNVAGRSGRTCFKVAGSTFPASTNFQLRPWSIELAMRNDF